MGAASGWGAAMGWGAAGDGRRGRERAARSAPGAPAGRFSQVLPWAIVDNGAGVPRAPMVAPDLASAWPRARLCTDEGTAES